DNVEETYPDAPARSLWAGPASVAGDPYDSPPSSPFRNPKGPPAGSGGRVGATGPLDGGPIGRDDYGRADRTWPVFPIPGGSPGPGEDGPQKAVASPVAANACRGRRREQQVHDRIGLRSASLGGRQGRRRRRSSPNGLLERGRLVLPAAARGPDGDGHQLRRRPGGEGGVFYLA